MKVTATEQTIQRVENFRKRLPKRFVKDQQLFSAVCHHTSDPVPFTQRDAAEGRSIREGEHWGEAWESAWIRLTVDVPGNWPADEIAAMLDFSGEGLVCLPDGTHLQGITNGSIFDPDFSRVRVDLRGVAVPGEKLELWVEAAANSLFGVYTDSDPEPDATNRYGNFPARVEQMRLIRFDSEQWHYDLDLRVLLGLVKRLPESSVRRARIIRALTESLNIYRDLPEEVGRARRALQNEMRQPASASSLDVTAIGHAHIDTAWLWPVRETIRKCARTFSSQLSLMERYPEYRFGASQPQHYQFIKEHYPDLYARVKAAVDRGQWEPQGGMWVESDCNLISGESMVRQVLYGKQFFKDEFDVDVDHLWLPDVFGYSPALPQILQKSGIRYFLTQKLSWNQTNEFPHHTFLWQGIDGSQVLTHFPPENTYNSQLDTESLVLAESNFRERSFIDHFISLFGVGDGGGGPNPENIETGRRMADLEGSPRVRFGTAREFFHRLEPYRHHLSTWVGELYLELHRGTLTSQAGVKQMNRRLERLLRQLEFVSSLQPPDQYPRSALDRLWKKLLLNQFHDIIPGSSIHKVYETVHREHAEMEKEITDRVADAARTLLQPADDHLVLLNVLHYSYKRPLVLPEEWSGCRVHSVNPAGDRLPVPVQQDERHTVALVDVPPYSFQTLVRGEKLDTNADTVTGLVLENDRVRYELNPQGMVARALDKEHDREILSGPGNVLSLYEDRPNNWDAWDIDEFYRECLIARTTGVEYHGLSSGPVRQGIRFELSIGRSRIHQEITLAADSKRLEFVTRVDWREKHRMLRTAFPVNVQSDAATFDIQYGFLQRPTHRNTSWEQARFEAVAHRYVDLSDRQYGVALLNDSKYGHHVSGQLLDLNLLRSPNSPDPDADQGEHFFVYALLPHHGELVQSGVQAEAAALNTPPLQWNRYHSSDLQPFIQLNGEGVSLETLKRAENGDGWILRIVETAGKLSTAELKVCAGEWYLSDSDLLEWTEEPIQSLTDRMELEVSPFEIRTLRLRRKK